MKKRIITLLAIVALLVTCAVFAVQADGTDAETGVPAQTPFNGLTDKCPHCGEVIAEADWTEFTASSTIATGKHYKISQDITLSGLKNSGATTSVIWIHDNVTVTAAGTNNAFRVNSASGKLWLLGGENSVLTGVGATATHAGNGGLLRVLLGGEMHIGGDLTVQLSGPVASGYMGGLVDINNGTLYIDGGTLYAPVKGASNTGTVRGVVWISGASGKLVMTGGCAIAGDSTYNVIRCEQATSIILKGNAYVEGHAGSSAVYMTKGTLTLDGDATVMNTNPDGDYKTFMYLKNPAKLQVAQTWDGEAGVRFVTSDGADLTLNPGATTYSTYVIQVIEKDGTYVENTTANATSTAQANKSFDGALYAYSPSTENPRLNGWQKLIMPRRFQIVYADGTKTWETDYNTTLNSWNLEDACIKVWATNRDITIPAGKTVYIDFNGKTLDSGYELTVNGTLYAFDSTATAPNAGVAISPVVGTDGTISPVAKVGENAYVVVDNTIYPVEVTEAKLTGVTLRPGASGLYFSASSAVNAHADVKDLICTGVAVSLKAIEDVKDTAWTANEGSTGNGILVQNIMKDTQDGDRSETKIYAEACVSYGGSVIALGDENVAITLNDLMGALKDEIVGGKELTEAQKTPLVEFVSKWNAKFGVWADLLAELSE